MVINLEAREQMVAKTGIMAVPAVDLAGEMVVGFNRHRLDQLIFRMME